LRNYVDRSLLTTQEIKVLGYTDLGIAYLEATTKPNLLAALRLVTSTDINWPSLKHFMVLGHLVCCHQRFVNVSTFLEFVPCTSETDTCIQLNYGIYEYAIQQ
jgi:hypothetical protein